MEEKIETLLEFLEEHKAKDLALFDARGYVGEEDYVVLGNFSTTLENKEFADELRNKLGFEDYPEGYNKGEWIIFAFDNILLHTFIPAKREKYNLDKLYQNNKISLKQQKKSKK